MAEVKTVTIKDPDSKGGYLNINESDFVAGEDELFETVEAEAADELGDLMKLNKAELITMATDKGLEIVPDELNKRQIAEKILAAE